MTLFLFIFDLVLKGLPKPVKQLLVLIKPLLSIPNKHNVASFAPYPPNHFLPIKVRSGLE